MNNGVKLIIGSVQTTRSIVAVFLLMYAHAMSFSVDFPVSG